MRPEIAKEFNDIYLGLLICLAGIVALVVISRWLYRRTFSYRVRPAILLMQKGQYSEAVKILSDLAIRFPKHLAYQVLLMLCFEQMKAFSEALDTAKHATEMLKEPESAKSHYVMAMVCQMHHLKGLSYQQAVQKWLKESSSYFSILKAYNEGDYQQALHLTEQAISATVLPHAKLLAWKAHFLLLLRDLARSGTVLSEAERTVPADAHVPIIRGHWYLVQGETHAAIVRYRAYENRAHIEEDLRHIAKVFGIQPPAW